MAAALGYPPGPLDPSAAVARQAGRQMYYEPHAGVVLRGLSRAEHDTGGDPHDVTLGVVWVGDPLSLSENQAYNVPAMSHACIVCKT